MLPLLRGISSTCLLKWDVATFPTNPLELVPDDAVVVAAAVSVAVSVAVADVAAFAFAFEAFFAVNPGGSFIFILLLVAFVAVAVVVDTSAAVNGFFLPCLHLTDRFDFLFFGIVVASHQTVLCC